EAVPRVDGLSAPFFGCRDDARAVQIAPRIAQNDDVVREPGGRGVFVRVAGDDGRFNAHFPARARDAQRDFAPVGDDQLLEQWPGLLQRNVAVLFRRPQLPPVLLHVQRVDQTLTGLSAIAAVYLYDPEGGAGRVF